MVYKILFLVGICQLFGKGWQKNKKKEKKTHKCKALCASRKSNYCCVLFDLTGKIHGAVQQQDLKTLTFICIENVLKASFIRPFIVTTKNLI